MNLKKQFTQYRQHCIAAIVISLAMGNAMATEIFAFTFTGARVAGYGTLYATANGNGSFTATSGTGVETVDGVTDGLTLVANPSGTANTTSSSGFFYFDNQLLPDAIPMLQRGGLLFNSSTEEINLFYNGANYVWLHQADAYTSAPDLVSFTLARVTEVPEPATTLLLFIGLTVFAMTRRTARANA